MKRTLQRTNTEHLTDDELLYLVSGPDIVTWGDAGPPFKSEEEALAKYQRFKRRIAKRVAVIDDQGRTRDDLFTNVLPGAKPWAWYAERGEPFPA